MGEQLSSMPTLGAAYRKALIKTVRSTALRRPAGSADRLEDRTVSVAGIQLDRAADRRLREAACGRAGEFASAEYLHVLGFPLGMHLFVSPEFPLPVAGLVHLSNSVEYLKAVSFDVPVDVRATVGGFEAHPSGTAVTMTLEISQGGSVVFTDSGVNLARGVYLLGRPEKEPSEKETFSGRTAEWRLGADSGRLWARVSGDFNPIHLSALSARALGMKAAIAHGMYAASRALEQALPAGMDAGFRWDVRFLTPITLPARVDVRFDVERDAVSSSVQAVQFRGWNGNSGKPHFVGSVGLLPR
jgi:acyl dehydratase